MRIGYTEFSYGYAFTENLVRSSTSKPQGAPVFPNLVQEAQSGYDVRIDLPACPLFFQFKLPELMKRNSATEISKHALSGISIRFFRMPLMRSDISKQHEKLIELEQKYPGLVHYASGEIEDLEAFNATYNNAQVHNQSVFFSPKDIGPLPDSKQHSIAYKSGLNYAWLCSEPREISVLRYEQIDEKVRELLAEKRYPTLEEAVDAIRADTLLLAPPALRDAENVIRDRIRTRVVELSGRPALDRETREVTENLLFAREIARVGLGLEMTFAQQQQ